MLAAILLSPLAWYAEYPGFEHFHNWDGWVNDLVMKDNVGVSHNTSYNRLPDGAKFSMNISKDLCAVDTVCDSVGDGGDYFRQMKATSVYDLYLATNASAILASPMCHLEDGGRYTPSTKWLCCDNDDIIDGILSSFALPPDLIHTSCTSDPDCVSFRVKNDGSGGDLLKKIDHEPGCFLIPAPSRGV